MVTTVTAVTALLVMGKVVAVAPAATVTETGTVAAAMLLLVSVTTAPPAGAAAASVTVPVEAAPLVTVGGLSTTDEIVGFTFCKQLSPQWAMLDSMYVAPLL